jgi:hypothetical protein
MFELAVAQGGRKMAGVDSIEGSGFALGFRAEGGERRANVLGTAGGREAEETYERLMQIAARTCYLHATLAATLEPRLSIELNGNDVL